jgi:hypothetical protein
MKRLAISTCLVVAGGLSQSLAAEPVRVVIDLTAERPRPNPVQNPVPVPEPKPIPKVVDVPRPPEPPKATTLPDPTAPQAPTVVTESPVTSQYVLESSTTLTEGVRSFYLNPFDTDLQTIHWAPRDVPYMHTTSVDGTYDSFPSNPTSGWRKRSDLFNYDLGGDSHIQLDGLIRGYYMNDQRIEWSGVEATIAGEGVLRPAIRSKSGSWTYSAEGEFFLNQSYSQMLSDPQRDLYRDTFKRDPFQVFQLFVQAQYDDFVFRFGRSRTPFGRFQSPMFTNTMADAPFLRTDVVSFTETGFFVRYQPLPFVVDLGVINGEPDLDTNSSKGGVFRIGLEQPTWTFGISGKVNDGISSEFQKRYNNHVGIDFSVRVDRLFLYGEAVRDEHGFHADYQTFDTNRYNFGPRSLYGRDVFKANDEPISGQGFYLGIAYRGDDYILDFNYGSYNPEDIGDPFHDKPINRAVLKGTYFLSRNFQVYGVGIFENKRVEEGLFSTMKPWAAFIGMQYGF